MANINELFNRRNDAIKFVDDYGSMILEAKIKDGEEPKTTEQEQEATEPTKATELTKAKSKLEKFLNKTKSEEKTINEQIFRDFFYETPSYLTRDLYDKDEIKNDEIIKNIYWIDLIKKH